LAERVRQLSLDTQRAEVEVEEYKREHGINEVASGVGDSPGTPLVDEELVALQGQLVQARATLSEKLAVQDGLRSLTADGSAADFSRFTDAPVIVDLRKQEGDILQRQADYAQRYGPLHPKMLAVKAELSDVENKIKLEIERMTHAVTSDVSVAQTQVDALERTLHEKEQQALGENLSRATLQSLEANAKSTRTAYETFVARLRDTQGQEVMQVPDGSIISRASVPQSPNPPSRSLIVAASIPIGLLLGLLVALFLERGTDGPATRPAVAPLLPVLVRIPKLQHSKVGDSALAESVVAEPASSFATAVRALEGLIPRGTPKSGFVVGICSPAASAGSAVLALSLSRAAAQRSRRVVVIDADPNGRFPDLLHIAPDRPGLSDVVLCRSTLGASVLQDKLPGVFALTAGRSRALLNRAYGGEQMPALLAYLRKSADLVIVCLPPLSGMYSGVIPLTALLDAFVLLIGWGGAPPPSPVELSEAMKKLKTKNAGLAVVE
jgi:Mrp family chromosome partitioning ATPase